MSYPRTIRNFNAFIDATSYFGLVLEAKLPMLDLETANHRGAGMDGTIEIDMGLKAMSAELTVSEHRPELIRLFGNRQRLVLRPAGLSQVSYSDADTYVYTIGGLWKTVDPGTMKPGTDAPLKLATAVDYLRIEMNGEELVEIDVENGKRVIGGTDQMAALREAMGL